MSQFGVEAAGRHKNIVQPGGRSESGVANRTWEHSMKALREQTVLTFAGQKSQASGCMCVGHDSGQQEEGSRGILDCRGCAPSVCSK